MARTDDPEQLEITCQGLDPCSQGAPLEDGCEPCVSTICSDDPFCCETNWDGICVEAAQMECGCMA